MTIVLSIAGSDPSGGAGIQQDMRAIEACGCYAATVITALTSQNTMGVRSVMPVPAEVVKSQLDAVLDDLDVKAIKIGQIPSVEVAEVIADALCSLLAKRDVYVVIDPVMVSTSGHRLMSEEAMETVVSRIFPCATVVTPNLPEYAVLSRQPYFVPSAYNLLVKGGHSEGKDMLDTLLLKDGGKAEYSTEKIASTNLHGTGCALSSAIAAYLAQGTPIPDAVRKAKDYVTRAIRGGINLGVGHGNGPVFLRVKRLEGRG